MSTPGPLAATPQALPPNSALPPTFQPAKYFTLIFFGLSLLICGLMALYISIQICRRRRRRRMQVDEEGGSRVLERQSVHASPPVREIPLKEGFMVSHPNGEVEVAYEVSKPEPEHEDAGCKEQQSTASQSQDSPRSHSGTDTGLSRHSSQQLGGSSSLHEPRSESSQRRLEIETQEEEDRRRRALYIWSL